MILLWLRIDCNVEIYSNCATSCCTIDLSSNLSYGLQYSMVLTTSNLLSFCVFQFCCHCYHLKIQDNSLVYREVTWNVKSDSKSKQNLYCEKCNSFSYQRRVITPYIERKEYKYAYPIFVQITFGSLIRKYYFCIGFQNGN